MNPQEHIPTLQGIAAKVLPGYQLRAMLNCYCRLHSPTE